MARQTEPGDFPKSPCQAAKLCFLIPLPGARDESGSS
jgi:hypothetical protein